MLINFFLTYWSFIEVGSPSAGAPTLSLLLEKPSNPLPVTSTEPPLLQPISDKVVSKSELLKIEQIKSELQEFEQQFRDASNSEALSNIPPLQNVPPPELMPAKESPQTEKTPEKIEIDDIEIKAEDVYAFSDIDLDIPPVSSIHKSSHSRTLHSDKNLFNKRELTGSAASLDEVSSPSGADSGTDVLNSLLSPMNVNENSNTEVPPDGSVIAKPPTPPPEPENQNQTEAAVVESEVPKEYVLFILLELLHVSLNRLQFLPILPVFSSPPIQPSCSNHLTQLILLTHFHWDPFGHDFQNPVNWHSLQIVHLLIDLQFLTMVSSLITFSSS